MGEVMSTHFLALSSAATELIAGASATIWTRGAGAAVLGEVSGTLQHQARPLLNTAIKSFSAGEPPVVVENVRAAIQAIVSADSKIGAMQGGLVDRSSRVILSDLGEAVRLLQS